MVEDRDAKGNAGLAASGTNRQGQGSSSLTHPAVLSKDTVQLPLLGLRPHAAQLLLVAAQAPGVVADLLRAQAAVPIQHLKWNI